MKPMIAELASAHRTLEARLKHLEGRAAKTDNPEERAQLKSDAAQVARELAAHEVPDEPVMYCDDETPESLARLVVRQGGRMLQAGAEGTAFEIAKGRYSETANFDIYLKGHSGDPLRTGRVSRDRESFDHPALSVALAVQPDVIQGLADQAGMRGRGFLARFQYSLPKSLVGSRKTRPAPVPEAVALAYRTGMLNIWRLTGVVDEHGKPTPIWLKFSGEADSLMEKFQGWLEPQLAEGRELSHMAGWPNKLAGAVARIAGILHMAHGAGGKDCGHEIQTETVEAAIRLGKDYLIPHARAAFRLMGADPRLHDARRIVQWLEQPDTGDSLKTLNSLKGCRLFVVSRSDIHAKVFGGSRRVEEVDPAVNLLVELGYLRPAQEEQRQGPGRKSSRRYLVNPHLRRP
jgi:hypothetical protein